MRQLALGVTGLAWARATRRARASRSGQATAHAVERYGRLAANEYRHGRNSPLGARYERLMQEARRAGIYALPELASLDASGVGTATLGGLRATETVVTEALSGADRPAVAQHDGARDDVRCHGAGGGHLYLMGEDGLGLAATVAAEAPEGLEGLVTSFWNQRVEEPEMPTAFIAEGPSVPTTSNLWTDARGTAFEPVPISCVVDGTLLHVGVAVLTPGSIKPRHVNATEVTSTIGKYLIQCGDARGVPA